MSMSVDELYKGNKMQYIASKYCRRLGNAVASTAKRGTHLIYSHCALTRNINALILYSYKLLLVVSCPPFADLTAITHGFSVLQNAWTAVAGVPRNVDLKHYLSSCGLGGREDQFETEEPIPFCILSQVSSQ